MAYKGFVSELPMGRAGMVNHENRLLSDPTQLLSAEGVTYEDDHVQRERGATLYDSSGLASAVGYSVTLSAARYGGVGLNTLLSNAATPAYVRNIGTDTDVVTAVSSVSLSIPVAGSNTPVGNLVAVFAVAGCPYNQNPGPSTVTDSKGNTWVQIGTKTLTTAASSRFDYDLWVSLITTQLVAGVDSITITWTTVAGLMTDNWAFAAIADEYSGTLTTEDQDTVGGSTTAATTLTTAFGAALTTLPELLIGQAVIDREAGDATITPGAGFTARGAVAITTSDHDFKAAMASRVDSTYPVIVGIYDWFSGAVTTLTGGGLSITTTAGSQSVTGVNTTFTDHAPGDEIMVAGEIQTISTISSNTALTTVGYWRNSNVATATYYHRVGRRIITVTSEGAAFKEKPATLTTGNLDATTLSSSLSKTSGPTFFVSGGKEAAANNRKLFIYTGVDPVRFLSGNGTGLTALTSGPTGTDWSATASALEQPIAGTIHQGRHVAWGNWTDPHRAYFSDPDDHADFATTGVTFTMSMRSDIGDRLYCGISFNGILYTWKYPRGILWLDDSDLDTLNWVIRVKSTALGCAPSPYAALAMDDDIIFMAANGSVHLLSAVDALGGTKASDLTHALGLDKWLRENVNLARLDRIVSVWDQHKKTAIFYVPSMDSSANDLALKFDFGIYASTGAVRFSWSERDTVTAVTTRRPLSGSGPEVPIIGDQVYTYLLDQDTFDKASTNYDTVIQTPHLDCSWIHPSYRYLRKQFDHLELVMEPADCDGDVTVEVYVDGTLKQTLTYDCTMRRQKKLLTVGDGHTISVKVTKSDADNVKLLSMLLYFHPSNEDQSR